MENPTIFALTYLYLYILFDLGKYYRAISSCVFYLFQSHFMIGWLCVRQFSHLIEKRKSLVKIVRQLAIEFMLRLSSISVG